MEPTRTVIFCENYQKLRKFLNLGKTGRFVESVRTCTRRSLRGPDNICRFCQNCEYCKICDNWKISQVRENL